MNVQGRPKILLEIIEHSIGPFMNHNEEYLYVFPDTEYKDLYKTLSLVSKDFYSIYSKKLEILKNVKIHAESTKMKLTSIQNSFIKIENVSDIKFNLSYNIGSQERSIRVIAWPSSPVERKKMVTISRDELKLSKEAAALLPGHPISLDKFLEIIKSTIETHENPSLGGELALALPENRGKWLAIKNVVEVYANLKWKIKGCLERAEKLACCIPKTEEYKKLRKEALSIVSRKWCELASYDFANYNWDAHRRGLALWELYKDL